MTTGDENESEYSPGTTDYHDLVNPDLHTGFFLAWARLTQRVDEELWQTGPKSERPTDPPAGSYYAAPDGSDDDLPVIYRYTGDSWNAFAGIGAVDTSGDSSGDSAPTVGEQLARAPNLHVQDTELANGRSITQRVYVPAGQTLTVYGWGVVDSDGATPTGLVIELREPSDSVVEDANRAWTSDTAGVASWENTADIGQSALLTITNETGTDYSAPDSGVSARIGYEVN